MECCTDVSGYYLGMTCSVCGKPFRNEMKTIKKVDIVPVYVDTMPDFDEMQDGKIYISEKYQSSTHKCLCGCGNKTVLPLNKPYGWNFIKSENGKISFTPSIGNYQLDCKSHYIITNSVANFV